MPRNNILHYDWFDTPNIHLCSCKDFKNYCYSNGIEVEKFICLNEQGIELRSNMFSNLFAYQVLFCVSKK